MDAHPELIKAGVVKHFLLGMFIEGAFQPVTDHLAVSSQ